MIKNNIKGEIKNIYLQINELLKEETPETKGLILKIKESFSYLEKDIDKILLYQEIPERFRTGKKTLISLEKKIYEISKKYDELQLVVDVDNTFPKLILADIDVIDNLFISFFDQLSEALPRKEKININFYSKSTKSLDSNLYIDIAFKRDVFTKTLSQKKTKSFDLNNLNNFITQANGKIKTESSPRIGTSFLIKLPLDIFHPKPPYVKKYDKKGFILISNNDSLIESFGEWADPSKGKKVYIANSMDSALNLFKHKKDTLKPINSVLLCESLLSTNEDLAKKAMYLISSVTKRVIFIRTKNSLEPEEDFINRIGVFSKSFSQVIVVKEEQVLEIDFLDKEEELKPLGPLSKDTTNDVVSIDKPPVKDIYNSQKNKKPPSNKNKESNVDIRELKRVPKILLIDDSSLTRQIMKDGLEKSHYFVDEAENGKQGLDLVNQNKYDLILVDLVMPELNGIEFTKIVRNIDDYQDVPIVGITGDANIRKENEFLFSGGDSFLLKSINPSILSERITNLLMKSMLYDKKVAETYNQGDEDRKRKLSELYLKEVQSSIKTLCISGDWQETRDIAHKLVSSSLYCGYMLTREKAMEMEESVNTGKDTKTLQDNRRKLLEVLRLTEEHLLGL